MEAYFRQDGIRLGHVCEGITSRGSPRCFFKILKFSLHAEVHALVNRSKNSVAGSDLYVVRLTETGLAASQPCQGCIETLREFGVKNIHYSTREGVVVHFILSLDHPFLFAFFCSNLV